MRMRISGGTLKGRTLRFDAHGAFRPTTERNRQMVFNILQDRVEGARFCDLYAGSGAMGMEAMSRGAAAAVFFDTSAECVRSIGENLTAFGLDDSCRVVQRDAGEIARGDEGLFDVIFMDPPYELVPTRTLELAVPCLVTKGILIYEHSSRQASVTVAGLTLADSRKSGDSAFSFYRKTV